MAVPDRGIYLKRVVRKRFRSTKPLGLNPWEAEIQQTIELEQ